MRIIIIGLVFLLTGCDDPTAFVLGRKTLVWVQKDQTNPCRVIITSSDNGNSIPPMSAIVEGCKP